MNQVEEGKEQVVAQSNNSFHEKSQNASQIQGQEIEQFSHEELEEDSKEQILENQISCEKMLAIFAILILVFIGFKGVMKEERSQQIIPAVQNKINAFYKQNWALTILDIDCGDCNFARSLAKLGLRVSVVKNKYNGQDYEKQNVELLIVDWNKLQNLNVKFDWVETFQINQNLPSEAYLTNIAKHARKGAIISWNLKDPLLSNKLNSLVMSTFTKYDFVIDNSFTPILRSAATPQKACQYFVFRKIQKEIRVTDKGFWEGTKGVDKQHFYFPQLKDKIIKFYKSEGAKSVVDFGCGRCEYAQNIKLAGFDAAGYDGNPDTYELSKGFAYPLDLGIEQNLQRRFDWVQSFEVGEHIPPQKTQIFVDNLVRHATNGVLLSWAVISNGFGHTNSKSNAEVIALMASRGFAIDQKETEQFRKVPNISWFQNTFMVFRRQKTTVYEQVEKFYKQKFVLAILDIECGDCAFARKLSDLGLRITVVKNKSAAQKFQKVNVLDLDWNKLQNLESKFHWVQTFQTNQSLPSEAYLTNIAKHARKGAIISWNLKDPLLINELNSLVMNTFTKHDFVIDNSFTPILRSYASPQRANQYFALKKNQKGVRAQATDKGYWDGPTSEINKLHWYFPQLKDKIIQFYKSEGAKSVVDFGCGRCEYARNLKLAGFDAKGYDGNPDTYELSKGFAYPLDLGIEQNLQRKFDWVQSFEVGEHIPPQKTQIFIGNLVRHATNGILMSWAVKTGGFAHINARSNDEIIALMAPHGYVIDKKQSEEFRKVPDIRWFKNTIMVFRKGPSSL